MRIKLYKKYILNTYTKQSMTFGVTSSTNGAKSIPLGSKITKMLPVKSASTYGGFNGATQNKDVLGNLMYGGIKSAPLDQNIMTNSLAIRGVHVCQPAYNSIKVLRRPPVKNTNSYQIQTGFARDQRVGGLSQFPVLKELPIPRSNYT